MTDYLDIITFKKDRHAVIQLNRPEKMNALTHNLRAELVDALKAALDWRDSPFGDYGSAPATASKPAGAAW